MTDYISREAFLADKKWLYCTDCEKRKGKKRGKMVTLYEIGEAPCKSCGIHDMLEEVEDYPAADVREVKRGKWEERKEGWGEYWICTSCGETLDTLDGEPPEAQDWKYCPYCGADMRQDEGNKEMSEVATREMAYAEYLND